MRYVNPQAIVLLSLNSLLSFPNSASAHLHSSHVHVHRKLSSILTTYMSLHMEIKVIHELWITSREFHLTLIRTVIRYSCYWASRVCNLIGQSNYVPILLIANCQHGKLKICLRSATNTEYPLSFLNKCGLVIHSLDHTSIVRSMFLFGIWLM